MADYTLEDPTVMAVLRSLSRHPDWTACEPSVLEQELDIPVADMEEEEEGYFMMRTDRVLEVVGAMQYLISRGFVEGEIRSNKDRFICAGIKLTPAGKDHAPAG
jgi:hypothetical protein